MPSYFEVLRDEIEPLVPKHISLVMDVGCGAGVTSRWLKQIRQYVKTVGVEIDPSIAAIASSSMDQVLVADIDKGLEALEGYKGRVDLLLLLDILEHLRGPWTRPKQFMPLLSPTGVVIASIPNVRSLKVVVPLLIKGEWRYQGSGILINRTHLRFFTRRTIVELFEGAGYRIQRIAVTGPLQAGRIKSVAGWAAFLANTLLAGALTDFLANQYLVRAVIAEDRV